MESYPKNLSEHKRFDVGPNEDNSPISGNLNARYLSCGSNPPLGYALLIRLTVSNFYEHYAPEMMAVIEEYLRRLLSQRQTCYKVSRTTEKEQLLHVSKSWGCTRNINKAEKYGQA